MINFSFKSEVLEVFVESESFDLDTAEQFRRQLRDLDRPVFDRVRIDLSEVENVRASAIGPLLAARRDLSRADKAMILVQPRPAVRSLLELMKLSDAFEIQNQ